VSETFVDVSCRGVEIGRRLHLSEIGPTGAYIEHSVPMPVGSQLQVAIDDGAVIDVVVVRVQEQVAGSDRSPGMFVRAVDLGKNAETWWRERATAGRDPVFPEPAVEVSPEQRATLEMKPEEIAAVTVPAAESEAEPEPEPEPEPSKGNGAGATIPGISAAAALAASADTVPDVKSTLKMTPDQVRAITELAPSEDQNGEADDDGPKGKKRKRRRKRKTKG
jgi:hypothetical protein